jgi:importin subunit beta-1
LDYELNEYVNQLREGIIEAYTGIVTGFKNTEQSEPLWIYFVAFILTFFTIFLAGVLIPYVPSILEVIQRCLGDEERTEILIKLCIGLVGDLADCFPGGEIKQLLLADWIALELRQKGRLPAETKKTIKWAREVRF